LSALAPRLAVVAALAAAALCLVVAVAICLLRVGGTGRRGSARKVRGKHIQWRRVGASGRGTPARSASATLLSQDYNILARWGPCSGLRRRLRWKCRRDRRNDVRSAFGQDKPAACPKAHRNHTSPSVSSEIVAQTRHSKHARMRSTSHLRARAAWEPRRTSPAGGGAPPAAGPAFQASPPGAACSCARRAGDPSGKASSSPLACGGEGGVGTGISDCDARLHCVCPVGSP